MTKREYKEITDDEDIEVILYELREAVDDKNGMRYPFDKIDEILTRLAYHGISCNQASRDDDNQ